jgi:ABC-type multidrug transport system ATPase subunit
MSEEILKALMQLFAIISKQDEGVSTHIRNYVEVFLKSQLSLNKVQAYLELFDQYVKPDVKEGEEGAPKKRSRLTSIKDSMKMLAICKQINQTLSQKQKVVVLIRLWELLRADKQYTEQRVMIINTVAEAFNIEEDEFKEIENFCKYDEKEKNNTPNILFVESHAHEQLEHLEQEVVRHIYSEGLDGLLTVIRVPSVELYFVKYNGNSELFINGLLFNQKNIYLLAPGSALRLPQGTIYYSDVVSRFLSNTVTIPISFNAINVEYKFPNGKIGLRNINISESSRKLIAIMGASGAGKTTLLNVLSGIERPSSGKVELNGVNIHEDEDKLKGLIGYIAQDDLLIEELTVFENIYYNAKLCFKDYNEEQLHQVVAKTLNNLGLWEIKDIKVGNPLNKKISGGQRKRLNIALELIREPEILFVDEPTSGLSSRDSENVMDLLKELSLKGKLIFVVIHQPSSDIYKMFDKLYLLDTGGYPIYYGNPIEAIIYFKTETNQINAEIGECHTCGNVNPELLFNIVEAKVVDDFGKFIDERKIKPTDWHEKFIQKFKIKFLPTVSILPAASFHIPGWFKQWFIFLTRDVKSKVSNIQYLLINLLEAPLLAFILAGLIRYTGNSTYNKYVFFYNDNIPAYIFISIIVCLFIGLTISAEEIFKDRKILKRERFLNLSKSSYLFSKLAILFFLSAIQAALFVLIGNSLLQIKGMFFPYWLMLFSVGCFANVLGLNISVTFNSAVTIYIIIPLMVIPQMILGGAMFSFDKINEIVGGNQDRTPVIADFFVSRWAFEGLSVEQFKSNKFEENFYPTEKKESILNYKQAFYIPKLQEITSLCLKLHKDKTDSAKKLLAKQLALLSNEIQEETSFITAVKFSRIAELTPDKVSKDVLNEVNEYLEALNNFYIEKFSDVQNEKNVLTNRLVEKLGNEQNFQLFKETYTNDYLNDLVKNNLAKNKIRIQNNRLIQNIDPIFRDPKPQNVADFRAHFYAPRKNLAGNLIPTYWFNLLAVWFFSIILYITLYYEVFNKILNRISRKFSVDD